MPEPMQIDRTSVVNDVIRCHPASVSVFNYFGVDACCGGAATIAEAAEHDFVDTEALVDALRGSARHAGRTRSLIDAACIDAPCCRSELPVAAAVALPASMVGNALPY